MNDLLEQFVVECRDLLRQAAADLLALERTPDARDPLDSVFRCFHTLKGAAGIVAFPAMAALMHAAEDVLSEVRAGRRAVSPALAGDCLECLDRVAEWLDRTERDGAIPDVADDGGLSARLGGVAAPSVPAGVPAPARWAAALLARHPAHRGAAQVAFRLLPHQECFFRNQDPLAAIAAIPDVLALEVAAARPWPPLQDLDPYECNLVLHGLAAAPAEVVASALRAVDGEVEIVPAQGGLPPEAVALLQEQVRLAALPDRDGAAGRIGAAGRVAAAVLRAAGRQAAAVAAESAAAGGDGAALVAAVHDAMAPPSPQAAAPLPATSAAPRAVRALRVEVGRIDALANLAGELTMAANAIGELARQARDGILKERHAALDRLVAELQRAVLAVRVLPLGDVFEAFPRLVREMSRELGKPVRLSIEGEATEADKTIVEALFEPLLHVLRNAVDHGVEPEAERIAAGKPPVATILLRARREGDQVVIDIVDDGRGIDTTVVRRLAAERGLHSAAALAEMTDAAVTDLIFTPGFSTARAVTGLSGRGVGMDAVHSAITRLGGRVTVRSVRGQGTTIALALPFSVLLMGVMTVQAAGQAFAIPVDSVLETTRVPRGAIAHVGAARAIVRRRRTLPLVRLEELLGLATGGEDRAQVCVIVTTIGGAAVAIEVERFGERLDVMVKPLDGLLAGTRGFAGTTVLVDGRVMMVLDLEELFA